MDNLFGTNVLLEQKSCTLSNTGLLLKLLSDFCVSVFLTHIYLYRPPYSIIPCLRPNATGGSASKGETELEYVSVAHPKSIRL